MKINLNFQSIRSGKSAILKIDNKTYIFNIYEGFQRYCIEAKQSLNDISVLFLTTKYNIPPLIATYLTLLDCSWDSLDVVSEFNVDFNKIHFYSHSPTRKFNFRNEYSDKHISVRFLSGLDSTNFLISFNKIRGQFHPERIPSEVPKNLYKVLIANKYLEYKDKEYSLEDYSEPEVQINDICLLFSRPETIPENVKCFYCFDYSTYIYLKNLKLDIENENDCKFKNLQGIYYIKDNEFVEYVDFYNYQIELNKQDKRYRIPFNFKNNSLEVVDCSYYLNSGDQFIYEKNNGFSLLRSEQQETVSTINKEFTLPCVHFLGTGCASPSKFRNVSSILYESHDSAILFDTGEDTYSQIERLFGNHEVLKKLKIVYISHSHADHMLGLARILKDLKQKVVVFGPADLFEYLNYFQLNIFSTSDKSVDFSTIPSEVQIIFISTKPSRDLGLEFYRNNFESSLNSFIDVFTINEFTFKLCACLHSKSSVSVSVLDSSTCKSISYSGDTFPSKLFAFMSFENDVMIHEATFVQGQEAQAKKTFHSLDTEAIEIFELSKSKKLFLTHFSNRNQKDAVSNEINERVVHIGDFFTYEFD